MKKIVIIRKLYASAELTVTSNQSEITFLAKKKMRSHKTISHDCKVANAAFRTNSRMLMGRIDSSSHDVIWVECSISRRAFRRSRLSSSNFLPASHIVLRGLRTIIPPEHLNLLEHLNILSIRSVFVSRHFVVRQLMLHNSQVFRTYFTVVVEIRSFSFASSSPRSSSQRTGERRESSEWLFFQDFFGISSVFSVRVYVNNYIFQTFSLNDSTILSPVIVFVV